MIHRGFNVFECKGEAIAMKKREKTKKNIYIQKRNALQLERNGGNLGSEGRVREVGSGRRERFDRRCPRRERRKERRVMERKRERKIRLAPGNATFPSKYTHTRTKIYSWVLVSLILQTGFSRLRDWLVLGLVVKEILFTNGWLHVHIYLRID